jgi:hypothetical protein
LHPGKSNDRGTMDTPSPALTAAWTLAILDPVKLTFRGRLSRFIDSTACWRSTQGAGNKASATTAKRGEPPIPVN